MDKNSQDIATEDKLLINTKVFVANSRLSNLSSGTNTPHTRPVHTKISKLTIFDSPESPAKFTVKSIHTLMNHDYDPQELVNKNVKQSFKSRNINLKEYTNDTGVEYEKKKLEKQNDCQNINNLLNEIKHTKFEPNSEINIVNTTEYLSTPPTNSNLNIVKSHRSVPFDTPNFKSKQILSAIESEATKLKSNNFTEASLAEIPSKTKPISLDTNQLAQEMESTRLETVLENTYQNKICDYRKKKPQQFVINQNQNNDLARSKTDLLTTGRSDYMQISPPKTTRSQSSINLNSDCTTDRKKSYNPEDARRFMQEQKKKRKLSSLQNQMTEAGKNPNDKEAIKKRLEDLRKNSLKILQRSVKIAKKKDPTPQQQYQEMPCSSVTRNINGQMNIAKPVNQREEENVFKPQNAKPPLVQNSSRIEKSNPVEITGKIGLLRKESDDNSFSALNEKENIVINSSQFNSANEMLQKITDNLNRKTSNETSNINILPNNETEKIGIKNIEKGMSNIFDDNKLQPVESSNIYEPLRNSRQNSLKSLKKEGIELKVPDVKLNSKILFCEKSVQCESEQKQLPKQNSLPYWLKPSPTQIYPYNFIMAVRKKLEAISNPALATNDDYKHVQTENNPKNTPVTKNKHHVRRRVITNKSENREKLNDLSNSSKSDFNSNSHKTKLVNNELLECITSAPAVIKQKPIHEKRNYNYSKSSTDTTSNFSSMSIHVPKSNKRSSNAMLSSTKINARNDDTTISSSVFSSPEKRTVENNESKKNKFDNDIETLLSPLSIENISNLKIKSKYLPDGINKDRGDISNNNNFPVVTNEVDFNQFLNDFNQSLSQVIEVDNQLKVTLDKSNQLLCRKVKRNQNDNKTDDYTSDFEEETVDTARNTIASKKLSNSKRYSNHESIASLKPDPVKLIQRYSPLNNNIEHFTKERNRNLEKHSTTDSDIVEIITSDTVSRTISVSLKSSKDGIQMNENSEYSTNSAQSVTYPKQKQDEKSEATQNQDSTKKIIKKDKPKLLNSSLSSSESDNHSLKIIHSKKIENLSAKLNLIEPDINTLNQRQINNLNVQDNVDLIPEKLNDNPPPAYDAVEKIISTNQFDGNNPRKDLLNSSASSEFVAIFNQSDFHSESNLSESTLNYSSIGLYEQLLQNENRKTEQLAAFLRMREKVILDRAKGQIAWLEVQREKLRSKQNLTSEESSQLITLKKKQRGILLKMEKERVEIQKLLQNHSEPQCTQSRPSKLKNRPKLPDKISDLTIRKSVITNNVSISTSIVRGFELQGDTHKLEEILKRREEELKKRREYVERLMEWHQRLDKEENEVLQIEKTLYNSNYNQICDLQTSAIPNLCINDIKKFKKLKEIDKSLKKIQNISDDSVENHKEISGFRLNKLWNRLTGRNDVKFVPSQDYDINKYDLEKLYEEAKNIVSSDFNNDEFLEQFKLNRSANTSSESQNINVNQIVNEHNTISNGYNNNNQYEEFENEIPPQREIENSLPESVRSSEKSIVISDKLINSASELTIAEINSDITLNISSEIKSNTGIVEQSIDVEDIVTSDSNEINNNQFIKESESLRPSVIVSVQKSQEDLFTENEILEKLPDEISIETKISNESTSISEINSEDLGKINSIISITNKSKISINSNESIEETSNLDSEVNIEHAVATDTVINENDIVPESVGNDFDISGKSSVESIYSQRISISATDIAESIKSKSTDQSSDLVRSDNEDTKKVVNSNEDTEYENELFESDTLIEDISTPKFELTLEESKLQLDENNKSLAEEIIGNNDSTSSSLINSNNILSNEMKSQSELEKRLIDIDDSLKDLTDTFERALSPDKTIGTPFINSAEILMKSPPLNDFNISSMKNNIPIKNFTTLPNGEGSSKSSGGSQTKMPDIISEVEIRRRQMFIDNEVKQLEQAIPYIFHREIPNKPPPPYHSPAHGSPMTIIFPSENRIKEITFRRTKELYDDLINNDNISEENSNDQNSSDCIKPKSVFDENITNIYERIVLDICQEYINEYKKTLIDSNPETYRNSLALFNPPDKLKCIQEFIYKNVRKSLGMDKLQQQQQQHHKLIKNNSLYFVGKNNKRDNVDDILIQELYEEESKWTNFDIEEEQVKHAIIDEILNDIIKDVIDEVVDESINLT